MREKRLERQKAQFPEIRLADPRSVFAVDRLRRERGDQPTSLGRAVEDTLIEDMSRGPTDAYAQSDTSEEAAPRGGYFGPSSSLNQAAKRMTETSELPEGWAYAQKREKSEPTKRSLFDDPGLGFIAGGVGKIANEIDRPRGALFGAAEGAAQGGLFSPQTALGAVRGLRSPQDFTGGDLLTRAGVGDRDLIGSLSARDIAGGVADVLLDPADIALGGALGVTDLAKGLKKGAKGAAGALNTPGPLLAGEATQQARILPKIADKATEVQQAPPIKGILDELLPTEQGSPRKVGSGLLRRYEGRLNAQGLEVKRDLDTGNQLLESVGIPKKTPRSPQMEGLFKALHGEGPVPAGMEDVYAEAKRLVDVETAATVDFNPSFTLHPDYFPRGWREVPVKDGLGVPGKGRFGATPGFAKPRSEASFSEILSTVYTKPDGTPYMLEPVSWNPMEMVALRRVAGAEFREQSELVRHLKDQGVALVADGPLPDGYRVPRVGPAFEGKPKLAPNDIPDQAPQFFGYTDRLAVPNKIADVLENIYGKRPSLGTVDTPFGEKDVLGLIRQTRNTAKRAKLIGSLFQQVDFTTRAGFATFGGAIDDVLSGKPISGAVKALSMPQEIGKLAWANTSAGRRAALRNQILSGDAIIPERPGISLKSIAEAGWRQQDISILPRTVRDTVQEITSSPPVDASPNLIKRAAQKAAQFEKATQDGLFDGVYPQAQIIALKNFVVPRLVRQHPDWTDAQIAANAATEINKMFSTLGEYQTVLKNPGMRELMHNVFFSSNEAESAIRAAGSTVLGPNKRLWAEYGAGGMLFLGSVANLVHLAATGEPLPLDRYQPIERGGPVGIRYKGDFLSPNVPGLKGRNGTQVAVDLMGQMDTIFRVLDPAGFISARFNVIPRTVINQARGEDFYGRPLNTPLERVQQAASDLALPIGAGNVAGALNIGPENEGRLGTAGQLVQASGLNLRAETTPNLLERSAKEKYGVSYADLEPAQKLELQNGQTPLGTELKQRRDTAIERQDENSIRQQSVEDLRTRVRQVQEANDSAFQSGQITIDEWKARRKQTLAEQSGAFDQIYKGYEPKPADAGKPWELYRQKLSELEAQYGSLTSEAMDDLDQWRASLSEEQNAAIDRNSGLYSTPFEKEYRAVGRELDSRQYFDIGDEVWKAIAASDPTVGQYKSVDAFRTAVSTEIVRTLSAQGIDPNSATARLVMEDVMSQIPQLKVWSDVKNDVEQSWIEANPDIAGRAYTYGYIGSLRKDEKKAIMLSEAR